MPAAPSPLPLALRRPPLGPELALWLLAPGFDLDADARALACAGPPYWAFAWASGQALARVLLDEPGRVRGRRVADLGAGSGIAAIAAARLRARTFPDADEPTPGADVHRLRPAPLLASAGASGETLV